MDRSFQSGFKVSPIDCALAIAVPLTREDFLNDLNSEFNGSFAKHVKFTSFERGASDDYYWEIVYAPVARAVRRICGVAENLGVTVVRNAQLSDLGRLLFKFTVVTMVTHWRFVRIRPEDLSNAPSMLQTISLRRTLIERALHGELTKLDAGLFDAPMLNMPNEQLASDLNIIITDAHRLYHSPADDESEDSRCDIDLLSTKPLNRLTRAALELSFPGHLRPAPAVQFADGMKTIPEVIETIPLDFSGLLDLTICNSVILGEAIKNFRSACFIAVNRYPSQLHVRLGLYVLTLRILARKPMSFVDALTKIAVTEF